MLKVENQNEFFGKLGDIIKCTREVESDPKENTQRIVLKQTVLGFIGNLCIDPIIRGNVARNISGILETVYDTLSHDIKDSKFE